MYNQASCNSSDTSLAAVICEAVKNPVYSLLIFAPHRHEKINEVRKWVNYAISFTLSIITIACIIKFISLIPGDIEIENKRIFFINRQIARKCRNEYISNNCNATDAPVLFKKCEYWRSCFEDSGQNQKQITVFDYTIDLLNNFFAYLTPKTAAILGSVCGFILFCNFYL